MADNFNQQNAGVLLATFIAVALLNTLLWLAKRSKAYQQSAAKAQLFAEIKHLRREAEKLNTPSTYAKCAKYQRMANAKEKELSNLESEALPSVQDKVRMVGTTAKVLVIGLTGLWLWSKPIAQIPRSISSPYTRLLASPGGQEFSAFGLVGILPWLMMCNLVSNMLAQAIFPVRSAPVPQITVDTLDSEGRKDL